MRLSIFLAWLIILSSAGLYTLALAQNDQAICAAPLNAALMTVKKATSGSKSASAESTWQCSFKFSSHDEAINAGLDVGATVYGVPLKVGGKFDKNKVSSWKDENCSQSAKSADYEAATFSYLREVAPESMRAFSECIVANSSKDALTCAASPSPLTVTVKWRRTNEDKVNPKIRQTIVSGGICQFDFAKGEKVLEGGIGGPCVATPKTDFAVYFQTDRGRCIAQVKYERTPIILGGKIVLTDARAIEGDVVSFAEGAEIITNGFVFTVVADEIAISGNARIKSFDGERSGRAAGDGGRSGGTTILQAKVVSGGRLEVALPGEAGASGRDGGKGATGRSGPTGSGNAPVWGSCKGAVDGGPGERGFPGENGGTGGTGGDGGNVVVNVSSGLKHGSVSRIDVLSAPGGAGGAAGNRGPGGDGGPGGAGGTGSSPCGGSDAGPKGPDGPEGAVGTPGKPGSPGTSTFVNS